MLGINMHEGTAEGWFGQGKKSAVLSIVAIAVLVIGTAIGIFIAMNGGEKVSTPGVVKTAATDTGTIQIPDGPKVKVSFNGPASLEAKWEKLGMVSSQLQLIGTLTNISGQTVKFSEVAFLLDNQQVAYDNGRTLGPGEQIKIVKAFPASVPGANDYAKALEIQIKGFEVIGGSATTAPSISGAADTPAKLVYKSNPETPGDVLINLFILLDQGKYEEAVRTTYLNPPPEAFALIGSSWRDEISHGERLVSATITEQKIEGNSATINVVIHFTNGQETTINNGKFKKADGRWWASID